MPIFVAAHSARASCSDISTMRTHSLWKPNLWITALQGHMKRILKLDRLRLRGARDELLAHGYIRRVSSDALTAMRRTADQYALVPRRPRLP
jgi:hypothetical protein